MCTIISRDKSLLKRIVSQRWGERRWCRDGMSSLQYSEAALVRAMLSLDAEGLQVVRDAIAHVNAADNRRANVEGKDFVSPINLDHGDTAYVMTCTTLVLLMTIPGLALFYGGLAQAPNVLSTAVQSFSITCIVTLLWLTFGYSMAFDTGNEIIGGPNKIWLQGMINEENGTIPESLYITFQSTFAVITAAIITGSIAERMRFGPLLIFISTWHLLVYCPLCHWEWGGGFMSKWGVLDFAGGDVVHISSGVSGMAASLVVGKRKVFGQGQELPPHNLLLVFVGASFLWVGWFGFNAGSALAAGQTGAMTLTVTHLSGCAGGIAWMLLEWMLKGKPSVLGMLSGAIAGLVVVTPGSGYMDQTGGIISGITSAPVCYYGIQLKHKLGYDDALDAFGVHGLGGVWGGIVTGLMANPEIAGPAGAFYGNPRQLGIQIAGILTTMLFSFIMTLVILVPLDHILKATTGKGVRCSEEAEEVGLDLSEHGESMLVMTSGSKVHPFDAEGADVAWQGGER